MQAVAGVGTFAHNVSLEGNSSWQILLHGLVIGCNEIDDAEQRESCDEKKESEEDEPESTTLGSA